MFDKIGHYHFILFTPDLEITPTSESIGDLLEIFKGKDFLPSTHTVLIQGVDSEPRLQLEFKTKDSTWNLSFEKTRVSLLHKPKNRIPLNNIENFKDEVCDIFNKLDGYSPFKGTRMSYLSKGLLPEMDVEHLKNLQYSFLNTIPFYQKNPSCEWSTRQVSRCEYNINDQPELINVISQINRTQGEIQVENEIKYFDRLEVAFDINTFQENKKRRFTKDNILPFLNEAVSTAEIISNQISEKVYES